MSAREAGSSSSESVRMTPRTSESDAARPSLAPRDSADDRSQSEDQVTETSPMLARWTHGAGDEDADEDGWADSAHDDDGIPPADDSWSEIDHSSSGLRKNKRVYGGGRDRDSLDEGELGPGEVAGMILAATLSPTPLLQAHAAALLGLPLFLPVLFVSGALSWFAYVVIGLEGRYCGSRSWPSLASAALPHKLRTERAGALLTSLLVFAGSLTRGIMATVASAELFVDVFVSVSGQKWWQRVILVGVIGLAWTFLPLIVMPLVREQLSRRTHATHSAAAALFRLPAYMALFLWPLALLVLGVRIKQLNLDSPDAGLLRRGLTFPPPPRPPVNEPIKLDEAMGLSIWGGISIVVFSLTCHHDAFTFIRSLARPSSTAQRKRRASLAPGEGANGPSTSTTVEGKRNQWPLACALGVGSATLIQFGWALVGYLGLNNGGREGNILSSPTLPVTDGWIIVVRALVLLAIAAQLESNLKSAYMRTLKAIELVFGRSTRPSDSAQRGGSYTRLPTDALPPSAQGWDWRSATARILVWLLVTGSSMLVCTWGETGQGLVSVAEATGCILSTLSAFLLPSIFFIILFHLRRPRSIFVSDPADPAFAADALLMRKERQVQRKLSGRRIWQDLLVFGGLLPFSIIVIIRGSVALVEHE
ncbi:hypothetical protein OIV83_003838 [Microbotryomycetes sp. JL201]|nr:hypothetical protein OIV83_003838 [Microbotryomycetes sp. JL201]